MLGPYNKGTFVLVSGVNIFHDLNISAKPNREAIPNYAVS